MLVGFIPARGGSKGIPRKNLQRYGGVPLVVHAIRTLRPVVDRLIVSTDDPEIAAVSRLAGAEVWGRPDHLADDASTVDQVAAWSQGLVDADMLLLQPTVPEVSTGTLRWMLEEWDGQQVMYLGVREPHIFWWDGVPLTGRENRQSMGDMPVRELGVRLYPVRPVGEPRVFPVDGPIVDVDTARDLAAARQGLTERHLWFHVKHDEVTGSGHLRRCEALAAELPHHRVSWSFNDERPGSADLLIVDALDDDAAYPPGTLFLENRVRPAGDVVVNALYGHGTYSGPRWMDVRPEFLLVPDYEPAPGRVLVSFGGTDPAGMNPVMMRLLDGLDVRVMSRDRQDFASMGEAMAWAGLVVTSGGRTVYEALACQRPVVAMAVNERETTHTALGRFGTLFAGLLEPERCAVLAREVAGQATRLKAMSVEAAGVVDGRGTERLCALIEGMLI